MHGDGSRRFQRELGLVMGPSLAGEGRLCNHTAERAGWIGDKDEADADRRLVRRELEELVRRDVLLGHSWDRPVGG